MRYRQISACVGALHFIEVLAFCLREISALLNHAPDPLLHGRPAQARFLRESMPGQPQALTVVIHKAPGAVQPCMTVAADSVLILQKLLRFLRRRIAPIKRRDPELAAFIPGTAVQDVFNVLLGNRKRGGTCLRADGFRCRWGGLRFIVCPVNDRDLFSLGGNQKTDLFTVGCRRGQA